MTDPRQELDDQQSPDSDAPVTADEPDPTRTGVADLREPQEEHSSTGEGEGRSVEELAGALAEAERKRDEYLDHLRRERAEFENFRKRTTKERMAALDRGAEALVANLLGVLDNFGFVFEAAEKSSDDQLAKGAQMVHSELLAVLRQAGLEEVPGVGEPFDPIWHEAMMQIEADAPVDQPIVAEVLRPGYRFKGRVLRPASVSVAQ